MRIPTPDERPWLRVKDVVEILGEPSSTVYDMIARGAIPSIRLSGRSIRIPTAGFRRWLMLDADEAISIDPERAVDGLGGHSRTWDFSVGGWTVDLAKRLGQGAGVTANRVLEAAPVPDTPPR